MTPHNFSESLGKFKFLCFQSFKMTMRNKLRSAFIVTILSVGFFGALMFEGLNEGIFRQYRINTISSKYGHGAVYSKGYWGKVFEEPWKNWINESDQEKSFLESFNQVKGVYPRMNFYALLTHAGMQTQGFGTSIDGDAESRFFNGVQFVDGNSLNGKQDGITLGIGLAKSLGAKKGSFVTVSVTSFSGSINAEVYEVVGISEMGAQEIDNRQFQIESKSAQNLLDTDRIEYFAIALKEGETWANFKESFQQRITKESLNKKLELIPFETLDWIYYGNSVVWLKQQFNVFHFILVAVVFLAIYQSVSMLLFGRKSEIGFQRANGENRNRILLSHILEISFLFLMGCFVGIALVYMVGYIAFSSGITLPPPPGFTLPLKFKFHLPLQSIPQFASLFFFCSVLATFITSVRILRLSVGSTLSSGSAQ
jgi:putative ABC transport system permease protein